MSPFSFQTIQSTAEGIYKEKSSKFLAFAHPGESEDEIKVELTDLRKKYFHAKASLFGKPFEWLFLRFFKKKKYFIPKIGYPVTVLS